MRWAPAWAVGHAGNDEIDAWGILAALRIAGLRAVAGALAISVLAAPVLLFAGDGTTLSGPLRSAQQAGVAMSTMITKMVVKSTVLPSWTMLSLPE